MWGPAASWSDEHEVRPPFGLRASAQWGEAAGGEEVVWETSHCIFPLLFLSHSFSAAHASSSLRAFSFSPITMSHIYPRLPAVQFAPLTLLSLPPPSLRWVDRTDIFSALPSFRTLSPCHFLFPSASSPPSSSSATKLAERHGPLCVTWLGAIFPHISPRSPSRWPTKLQSPIWRKNGCSLVCCTN